MSIVAEGDRVILSFVHPIVDPKDANRKLTTTFWFDMFRIEDGKIAEHSGIRAPSSEPERLSSVFSAASFLPAAVGAAVPRCRRTASAP